MEKYTPDDLVTLLVGVEEKKLLAFEHNLVKSSGFFQAALKKEWKEGQTRVVKLPEETIETTTCYLEFVCEGNLPTHATARSDDVEERQSYRSLCLLYGFGERVLNDSIRNAIVQEILQLMSLVSDDELTYCPPDWEDAAIIYQSTTAQSPMRRFMVDVLLAHGSADWLDESDVSECPELLVEVVKPSTIKFSRT